jgi:hypothetical protein
VLQLPLSLAYIGLVLNHWQVAHRTGKEKLAPPALTRLPKKNRRARRRSVGDERLEPGGVIG